MPTDRSQQAHAERVKRDDEMFRLHNEGKTWQQIADIMGLSYAIVNSRLTERSSQAEYTPRIDSLPEGGIYLDTGCRMADSCLNCHLEQCIEDVDSPLRPNRGLTPVERVERDDKIFELRKHGVPLQDIQRRYNLSQRQTLRIIEQGGASDYWRKMSQDALGNTNTGSKPVDELKTFYKARQPWPAIRGAR